MNEFFEAETQKKIYLLISKKPGLNLSKVADLLGISVQLAQYHLHYLEKNQIIISEKSEGYIRYYVKGEIGQKDKRYLSLFRQEKALKIVLFLLKNPYSRHKDIMEVFDMPRSLVTYHLKKLIKKNIIGFKAFGNEHRYYVIDERNVILFLINYEPYNMVKGLNETWTDFNIR